MTRWGLPRAARYWPALRSLAGLAMVGSIVSGCLSLDEPSPAPTTSALPSVTLPTIPPVRPSAAPRDPESLIVAVATYPRQLLPPASDEASALLLDLLYDPLYRLDEQLVPHPWLAADVPKVSEDGLTWSIDLAPGDLRFTNGDPVTAADVVATLRIARSPACSLDRELCDTARNILDSVEAVSDRRVKLSLTEPYAPLLAEVLAQMPILDDAAVRAGAAMITRGAAATPADAPDRLVTRVYKAIDDDGCLVEQPPPGCDLKDHTPELEAMLTGAGLGLPPRAAFTSDMGQVDEAAYANELLDRVASLGQVLSARTETDRLAAALPLLDLADRPLGSGPYRVVGLHPGVSVDLEAVAGHMPRTAAIPRISLQVVADPAVATTRLLSGDVDWVLRTDAEQAAAIAAATGATAGARPLPSQWSIVFNTRKGHPYADARVRHAFAECVDRTGLTTQVGEEAIVATTPIAPESWAMDPSATTGRDVAAANATLDATGWVQGIDGIRVRNGIRLSSTVAIRASQASLLAFAQSVATQVRECGIDFQVQDLDLTGGSLFEQLRWPNDFDTLLAMRALAVDPDADLEAFESSHATSADQVVDANPGGYASSTADKLIREARETTDRSARTDLYGRLQDVLDRDVPAWSIWYDTEWSALADRVRDADGPIDPRRPRFDWDVASWTLDPQVVRAMPSPSP